MLLSIVFAWHLISPQTRPVPWRQIVDHIANRLTPATLSQEGIVEATESAGKDFKNVNL